jgi:hypothetical protein
MQLAPSTGKSPQFPHATFKSEIDIVNIVQSPNLGIFLDKYQSGKIEHLNIGFR